MPVRKAFVLGREEGNSCGSWHVATEERLICPSLGKDDIRRYIVKMLKLLH